MAEAEHLSYEIDWLSKKMSKDPNELLSTNNGFSDIPKNKLKEKLKELKEDRNTT